MQRTFAQALRAIEALTEPHGGAKSGASGAGAASGARVLPPLPTEALSPEEMRTHGLALLRALLGESEN